MYTVVDPWSGFLTAVIFVFLMRDKTIKMTLNLESMGWDTPAASVRKL